MLKRAFLLLGMLFAVQTFAAGVNHAVQQFSITAWDATGTQLFGQGVFSVTDVPAFDCLHTPFGCFEPITQMGGSIPISDFSFSWLPASGSEEKLTQADVDLLSPATADYFDVSTDHGGIVDGIAFRFTNAKNINYFFLALLGIPTQGHAIITDFNSITEITRSDYVILTPTNVVSPVPVPSMFGALLTCNLIAVGAIRSKSRSR